MFRAMPCHALLARAMPQVGRAMPCGNVPCQDHPCHAVPWLIHAITDPCHAVPKDTRTRYGFRPESVSHGSIRNFGTTIPEHFPARIFLGSPKKGAKLQKVFAVDHWDDIAGLAWLGFGRLAWFALAWPLCPSPPRLGLSQEQQHSRPSAGWRGFSTPCC